MKPLTLIRKKSSLLLRGLVLWLMMFSVVSPEYVVDSIRLSYLFFPSNRPLEVLSDRVITDETKKFPVKHATSDCFAIDLELPGMELQLFIEPLYSDFLSLSAVKTGFFFHLNKKKSVYVKGIYTPPQFS